MSPFYRRKIYKAAKTDAVRGKQECMESAEQGRTSLVLVRHKFGSSLEGGGVYE